MLVYYPPAEIEKVSAELTAAWYFLSGQTRVFEALTEKTPDLIRYAEFTFFMPFTLDGSTRRGGVGILIGREDAKAMARHMFSKADDEITQADLVDACSEACNVCSESIARHFGEFRNVKVGFPQIVTAGAYQMAAEKAVAGAIYRGACDDRAIFCVLYEKPNEHWEPPAT